MPTPEQIAEQVRRRPIGAVIGDICRDLGIMPRHPLWNEIRDAVAQFGGNFAKLYDEVIAQALAILKEKRPRLTPPMRPPLPAPARPCNPPPDYRRSVATQWCDVPLASTHARRSVILANARIQDRVPATHAARTPAVCGTPARIEIQLRIQRAHQVGPLRKPCCSPANRK